jgi:hypothetical protein
MTGLSARNLKYMRAFAEARPDRVFVQQVVARYSQSVDNLGALPGADLEGSGLY